MSGDSQRELAELVRDVRALVEDADARGVDAMEVSAEEEVSERPSPEEGAAGAEGRLAEWSEAAAAARDAEEPADLRLSRVQRDLGDCQRCGLARGRKKIVFGVGSPEADLVVVGEAPGYHEDQQGEPFVGPAGQMLDRMLENVLGLPRDQVYILNVVKCRPPKNRNPLPDEVDACRPFLEAQLDAIRPKVMLVLGSVAFRTLFDTDRGIKANRGRWRDYRDIPTLPTFHPAYLLRQPQDKRLTFEDLKALRRRYDDLGGRRVAESGDET